MLDYGQNGRRSMWKTARTLYRGKLSSPFETKTGVRQGSIEGPTLWNIFYCFLILDWQSRCKARFGNASGVPFEYTLDGILRTAFENKQRSGHNTTITDVEYADDLVMFETDFARFEESARILDETCTDWGAEISTAKTKWIYVSPESEEHRQQQMPELYLRGVLIERVHEFNYLGSIVGDSYSLGVCEDALRRVSEAAKVFGRMKPLWRSRKLTRNIKKRLFLVCVSSTLFYGSEHWPYSHTVARLLDNFWYSRIRMVLGISWERVRNEHISNEQSAQWLGVPDWRVLVGRRHARWLGHVARMAPKRLARQTLFGSVKGRGHYGTATGTVRKNLVTRAQRVLDGLPELDIRIWAHLAQDQASWAARCDTWTVGAAKFSPQHPGQCPLCTQTFRNANDLGRHISTMHPVSSERFVCDQPGCTREFGTKNARTLHIRKDHGVVPAAVFPCPHAGCRFGPFLAKNTLDAHLRVKHVGGRGAPPPVARPRAALGPDSNCPTCRLGKGACRKRGQDRHLPA